MKEGTSSSHPAFSMKKIFIYITIGAILPPFSVIIFLPFVKSSPILAGIVMLLSIIIGIVMLTAGIILFWKSIQ